jgi:predicted 3-demethylubiquinone-9 3-methyltransferase (glyoxalase superfamily)
MVIIFQLNGQNFMALNGGPIFKLSEAVSLVVNCADQAEVDYYWKKLSSGGDKNAQQCGWLKDKFGLSWQIVPDALGEMLAGKDTKRTERVMQTMLLMKKIDIEALRKAYA